MSSSRFIFAALIVFLVSGCANYAYKIAGPRSLIEQGRYDQAITELKVLAEKKDNDELLYLFDLGIAYHRAGQYKEAIAIFQRADKIAEIKDYTSVTQEVTSVLLSDEVKPYKGEDFEKLLIHVYLAIDFTLLNNFEDALVACRKVNHIIDRLIAQGQLPYERNAFAKYLSASLFESQGELNSALVDYRQLYKWFPDTPFLKSPILKLTSKLQMEQEFNEYKKAFGVEKFKQDKDKGEVVLILEQGRAPLKHPAPQFRLIPVFRKRYYSSDHVVLRRVVDQGPESIKSEPLFDIEQTAIRELDGRLGLIMAKKLTGVVAKEIVADQVGKATDSKLLGSLTGLFLHLQDQADLRSWTTLPARLQIARLKVPKGKHRFEIDLMNQDGSIWKSAKSWEGVEIKPQKITFLHYRTQD